MAKGDRRKYNGLVVILSVLLLGLGSLCLADEGVAGDKDTSTGDASISSSDSSMVNNDTTTTTSGTTSTISTTEYVTVANISSTTVSNVSDPEIPTTTEGSDIATTTIGDQVHDSLTEEQRDKLNKFREKMIAEVTQDYMKTDDYLVRWLIAQEWDLEAAEKMLQENLAWRAAEKMDTIQDEDWTDMVTDFPYTKDTVDKYGRPVGTINIALWNIRGASYANKMERLNRYLYKLLDEATHLVIRKQAEGHRNVTKWRLLMNMDGFGLRQHACTSCLSFYKTFAVSYEAYFPGYVDSFVLINTPGTFRVVLSVIRPFLSGRTQNVILVFGRSERTWKEYLDQEIDASQRRAEFGGTKEDTKQVDVRMPFNHWQ